jgi:hypothetical protein
MWHDVISYLKANSDSWRDSVGQRRALPTEVLS